MKNLKSKSLLFGLAVVLCVAGCNTNSVLTYSGETLPLEQVAVLTPTSDTCHVISVDGENHVSQRSVGSEFHLLPGVHNIAIFYRDQSGSVSNSWVIKEATLEHSFEAGHVYTVSTNSQTFSTPEGATTTQWTPAVEDLGRVEAFAANNPNHEKWSGPWSDLRKQNDLNPSFFDFFNTASSNDVQQH
jgi:hypothetical protein